MMDIEKEVAQEEKPKKSKKKTAIKYIINISIVFILTVVALIVTLAGDSFNSIINLFKKCDWRFVAVVFAIMFASILVRAFILFLFGRLYKRNYHYHQAMAVEQIGVFYSAVTPGATGGQFMESYTYNKQGIPISSAVSIIAMSSIMYQVVLILYGLLAFIIKYDFISQIGAVEIKIAELSIPIPIWLLTIFGFILNVSLVGVIFLMSYWRGFHHFIMGPCISFLNRIKIIKNPDKSRESLRISVENFKIELKRLFTNIPFTILMTVLFFGFFTLRFCIPYFCGIALGNQSGKANFMDAVFLGNYHQMVTGLIPIPGSAGVSEYFFYKLFGSTSTSVGFYAVFDAAGQVIVSESEALTKGALLLWRTCTFTIPMIIAGLTAAFYHGSPKDVIEENNRLPNHHTFVNLQKETYVARVEEMKKMAETNALSRQAILDRLKINNKKKTNSKHNRTPVDKYDDINIDDED